MARLTETLSRKYYFKRLWKITFYQVALNAKKTKYRIFKAYERRYAVGSAWIFVRGSTVEPE